MQKLKASGMLYFLLLIMSIFLIIQIRISLSQEEISLKELKNPISNTKRKILENDFKFKQAIDIIYSHYDKNYNLIHDDSINDVTGFPYKSFIVFKSYKDDTIKKSDENFIVENIITDGIEAMDFDSNLTNKVINFEPVTVFDTNFTKIYTNLGISNIRIPIVINENGRIKSYSPILKVSEVKGFETGKGTFVTKVDISIVIPYQVENQGTKLFFKEYTINTNEIISNKLNYVYDTLDFIANSIISNQKMKSKNAEEAINVLAPMGAGIKKYDLETNTSEISHIGYNEKIGVISSGLMYIAIGTAKDSLPGSIELEGFSSTPIGTNSLVFKVNENKFDTISNGATNYDLFEVDFRRDIYLSKDALNLKYQHDDLYGFQRKDSIYKNQNYLGLSIDPYIFEEKDLNETIHFCSLNTKCGIKLDINSYLQIRKITNYTMAEALMDKFSILYRDIKSCKIENKQDSSYLLKGKENPFSIKINTTDCGNNVMDFMIDNSSSLNHGANMFNINPNLMVFTLGVKNDFTFGCQKCEDFPFIFKKYFISKE